MCETGICFIAASLSVRFGIALALRETFVQFSVSPVLLPSRFSLHENEIIVFIVFCYLRDCRSCFRYFVFPVHALAIATVASTLFCRISDYNSIASINAKWNFTFTRHHTTTNMQFLSSHKWFVLLFWENLNITVLRSHRPRHASASPRANLRRLPLSILAVRMLFLFIFCVIPFVLQY